MRSWKKGCDAFSDLNELAEDPVKEEDSDYKDATEGIGSAEDESSGSAGEDLRFVTIAF